jgi:tRNA U54 and U55 pseudouridine synthase Pus10
MYLMTIKGDNEMKTTKKSEAGLKHSKPCKRCEGRAAGRDGFCKECQKELVELGRDTSLEGLRLDRDMMSHRGDLDGALSAAIAIDRALGRY